ncbi:class I SAM-dependent methyltransferase [Nonomuraea sp. NPDC050202]|uniref:class I SAM-dependent methyltransferase n=1 Tax=Nonomuraea sp. NPDC050202 TaxID=3155035 RepID=UPI0033FB0929
MIQTLPRVIAEPPGKPAPNGRAKLQQLARQIATHPAAWNAGLTAVVRELFDQLAAVWDTEHATGRTDFLTDALARGGPWPSGTCLELGSGTGQYTPVLSGTFNRVIALNLAREMLTRAPAHPAARIQADAARLPLADASISAVACVDVLLFAREITRVLAAGGVLIWANQLACDGPLFLDTATVITALNSADGGNDGGAEDGWSAVQAEAGWGNWAVLRRTGRP